MSASIQTGITQYSSLEDFHPADHHPLTDQPNLNKSQEALTPEEELALEVSSLKKQIADEYSRYEKTHQSMNRVFQQCAYDYNLGQSHYSFRSQRFASDQIGLSINLEIKLLDEEAEERIILEKALDCFVSSILNYEKRKGYRFSDKQTTLTVEVPAKFDNYKPLLLAKLATLSLKVSWTKGDQLRFLVNINSIDFLENAFLECRQNVTDLERAIRIKKQLYGKPN